MKYSLVEIRLRVRFPSQILQAGRTLQCRQMMQNRAIGQTSSIRLQIRSPNSTAILFVPVNEKKKLSKPYKRIKINLFQYTRFSIQLTVISPFPPAFGGHWLEIKTISLEGGNSMKSDDEQITSGRDGSNEQIVYTTTQ